MRWLYRLLVWADGLWHAHVCPLVERYADEPFEQPLREQLVEAMVHRAVQKSWTWGDIADAALGVFTGEHQP